MNESERPNSLSGVSGAEQGAVPFTPARWQQIKEVFSLALEKDQPDRRAFLSKICAGDQDLQAEVESLLMSADDGGAATSEVFRSVSTYPAEAAPDESEDPMVGRRVGDYRIDRRIAYGGMAAVYLASRADEQFHMQAAIKLLRPDLDRSELLRRFVSERQTLAALDHSNIVKLLDGGSTDDGLPYLVMDYVAGKPIDEYCDAHSLSIQQRLRLFCKVCDAVHFAHQHHVIHRDLKPSNILVGADGTPKLLDFGIAKVLDPLDQSERIIGRTTTRHLTPAYASPEQVRGEQVGVATDVYSLGVVLFELLTGHRPYRLKQRTPAAMERAICEQEPESPSTAVDRIETESRPDGTVVTVNAETVSRTREGQPAKLRNSLKGDLDNIVLKTLQKDAQRRYASVTEFAEDIRRHLENRPVRARPNTLGYRTSKFIQRRKTETIAAVAILVILAVAVAFSIWVERESQRGHNDIALRSGGRRAVAVMGFKNLSGKADTAWLSTALSEMLTTELAAGGNLRVISGEDVGQIRTDLSLAESDSFSAATLRRIYKNLNSDYVVGGSFVQTGDGAGEIRLDLRLQDAVRGETIAAVAEKGTQTDLSSITTRAGTKLREKLGVVAPTVGEALKIQASLPATTEAAKFYAEGLEKQRLYDSLAARDLFQKAVAADPNFAMAHLALSDVAASSGDSATSRAEAKKAFDLSAGLSREQSLMIQARYYEALHQWDKAIELRQTLFNFFPDSLDHGLQLVGTEVAAAKGPESLATLELLRKLPLPERNNPRIDLAEALVANVISDYKRQASAAEITAQKAHAIGARLLVARALISAARAYMELGQRQKVAPALSEALNIYTSVGDRFHEARVLQQMGLEYYYQSKLEDAKKTYAQALAIQRELGNRANEAKLLNGIAMVSQQESDLEGAKQGYLQALAVCREINDRAMTGTVLSNLGGVEIQLSDLQSARAHLQESLAIARQVGEQSGIALALENLGEVTVSEGDLRAAVTLFEESVQVSRKTGKKKELTEILLDRGDLRVQMGHLAAAVSDYQEVQQIAASVDDQDAAGLATWSLGEVQFEKGQLTAARQSYEQAVALLDKSGDKKYAQNVRVALAELDLESGRPGDAERECRAAMDEFQKAKAYEDLANAETILAPALLAQHKIEDAQNIAADAVKHAAKTSRAMQITTGSLAAEIQSASGQTGAAIIALKSLVDDCHRTGFVQLEFRIGLVLGETEIRASNRGSGRAHLASLERDASAKGFLRIATKAAAQITVK